MKTMEKALKIENLTTGNKFIASATWLLVGAVATYLTTTTTESQIAGHAFCSLFSNNGDGLHHAGIMGHCVWCYAAAGSFATGLVSLFKKA